MISLQGETSEKEKCSIDPLTITIMTDSKLQEQDVPKGDNQQQQKNVGEKS
jgi:hypothetical protein